MIKVLKTSNISKLLFYYLIFISEQLYSIIFVSFACLLLGVGMGLCDLSDVSSVAKCIVNGVVVILVNCKPQIWEEVNVSLSREWHIWRNVNALIIVPDDEKVTCYLRRMLSCGICWILVNKFISVFDLIYHYSLSYDYSLSYFFLSVIFIIFMPTYIII